MSSSLVLKMGTNQLLQKHGEMLWVCMLPIVVHPLLRSCMIRAMHAACTGPVSRSVSYLSP